MTRACVTDFRIRFSRALRQRGGLLLQEMNLPKTNPTLDLRRKKFISLMRLQHTPSRNHRSLRRREVRLLIGLGAEVAGGARRGLLRRLVRGLGSRRWLG